MTDRPIIFSGPMVRALLEGRKTMTRRLATSPLRKAVAGDRLWVRESFRTEQIVIAGRLREQARYPEDNFRREFDPMRYKPSIHMPRWASRLTLIVRSTKIERLQDITEADATAEGAEINPIDHLHRTGFVGLWRSLHGDDSWNCNPEVVALSFRVALANIDTPDASAA